jgi:hypothetical protein
MNAIKPRNMNSVAMNLNKPYAIDTNADDARKVGLFT